MEKSYCERLLEKNELVYALLCEIFGQKCEQGEVNAENVSLYSAVLEDAKYQVEYQKKNIERDKAEEANSAVAKNA